MAARTQWMQEQVAMVADPSGTSADITKNVAEGFNNADKKITEFLEGRSKTS